jgi:hypothetical protein
LSSFAVKVRNENIELTVPEHIPAFSKKKFLKREILDPRTIVIVGDNETVMFRHQERLVIRDESAL